MDLAELRDFVSVARAGSFAAAAQIAGVPKSTLSKRVRSLEASLGMLLMERTTRRLRLTHDGALLLERASHLLAEADDLEGLMRARDAAPRGRLRVSAPVLFGQAFMGRIAAAYTTQWPDTAIDVVFSDRRVDLIEEDFDCAIRLGPMSDSSAIVRSFARSSTLLVASPNFVAQREPPTKPADLADWPTISFAPQGAPAPWLLQNNGAQIELRRTRSVIALSSLYAVRDAAEAGAGVALLPEFITTGAVASGTLAPILPDWRGPAADVNIVYPSRRHVSARLRAFIDIVLSTFPDRTLVNPRAPR